MFKRRKVRLVIGAILIGWVFVAHYAWGGCLQTKVAALFTPESVSDSVTLAQSLIWLSLGLGSVFIGSAAAKDRSTKSIVIALVVAVVLAAVVGGADFVIGFGHCFVF